MCGMNTVVDPALQDIDTQRRFGGMARLYGAAGATRIAQAHGVVVGIGGVGSWAAECLARSGVGRLTLIDLDHVAESNVNRQVHALTPTLGQAKVLAMRERIAQINPACVVHCVDDFVTPDNASKLIPADADALLDCIDQVHPKVALALLARDRKLPLIMAGAAGGKVDASQLRADDLAFATHDPLLARVRGLLRKQHGFPAPDAKAKTASKRTPKMGVRVIYSAEAVRRPQVEACETSEPTAAAAPQGLSCAGYGSAMHITASMGLMAAGALLNTLAQ
ncbi:hypothetical protein IP84_05870 [beta proteobacterium AAP99]|nr:hypothetical protein IP84_05870 [beta proteobacterium AAP99]